jgi:crossover junction endodeoxyribonuclease RusA
VARKEILGRITLEGDPKSTQHIYRSTARAGFATTYMTKEGKIIKETYQWDAKSQWKQPVLNSPLDISIRFFFGSKRKRDLDNQNKLVLDALTGIVYEDDSQIDGLHLYRDYDKAKPRIEIEIASIQ